MQASAAALSSNKLGAAKTGKRDRGEADKKKRLSNMLPQKILKKWEPGVTMEDLQQSGNDM